VTTTDGKETKIRADGIVESGMDRTLMMFGGNTQIIKGGDDFDYIDKASIKILDERGNATSACGKASLDSDNPRNIVYVPDKSYFGVATIQYTVILKDRSSETRRCVVHVTQAPGSTEDYSYKLAVRTTSECRGSSEALEGDDAEDESDVSIALWRVSL